MRRELRARSRDRPALCRELWTGAAALIAIARRVLIGLLLVAAPLAARAEPFVPDDDATILARVPAARDRGVRELAARRAQLAEQPANLDLALPLAAAYIARGRSAGDPRYDGYAQAALAPWWDLAEPPIPVLILRRGARAARHDFAAALGDLERVLARQPGHPQALLSKATVLGVQGEPAARSASCAALAGRVARLSRPPARPARRASPAARATATACSRRSSAGRPRRARAPGLGAHDSRRARRAAR